MSLVLEVIFGVFLIWISYKFYRLWKVKEALKWMPSIPGWPILGNVLEIGSISEAIFNLSRILRSHGKLLLLDFVMQPVILTNDYDFVEFLLSTNNILSKSQDYQYLNNWLGSGLLTSDGFKWKKRRRMLTPAFHFSILEKFVDAFESNGKVLIEKLSKEIGKEFVDIYPFINLYALDVICESAMGIKMEAQKNKNVEYVKNVKEMCRITVGRSSSLLKTNNFCYRLSRDYYKEKNLVEKLHEMTYSVIDQRAQKIMKNINDSSIDDNDNNDNIKKKKVAFLDILLQSTYENGQPLSKEDIREEVDTFMFEGHDTTTSAMSFTLYLLAKHRDIQNQVLDEQISIFGDDIYRRSYYQDLQQMKYLEQVIKESLRMYPPVPLFGRHTTEDVSFKGEVIPKGMNIIVYSYGVLNDPDNFPNPEIFDPSRFENIDGKRPYSYIPFSAGPRNCIGQKFAMLEIKSTVSQILRHFELLPVDAEHQLKLIPEAVLKSKNGIKIKIRERTHLLNDKISVL